MNLINQGHADGIGSFPKEIREMRIRISVLLFLFAFIPPAAAANGDAAFYKKAFQAVASGSAQDVQNYAAKGGDPILNKVLRGYAMAMPGNDFSFDELDTFMKENPAWPGLKGIQMIAEQKIPDTWLSRDIIAWYEPHPPLTLIGLYKYVDALDQTGQMSAAQKAVAARWIEGNFNPDEQLAFFARFASLLDNTSVWARTDHLLWDNNATEARRMIPYLSSTDRMVAETRLSLCSDGASADWMDRIPSDARSDPGLLYQRLRWYVKNGKNDDAYEILLNAPSELGRPEPWWQQRHIMVRRAIESRDFRLAYQLASNHGQTEPKSLVQAEFLSGWLALRFLDRPETALQHFRALYGAASTPMSRSRGAYWMGRSYEALGDREAAIDSYKNAAAYGAAFYGQLALARLYAAPTLTAKADPPLAEAARRSFMARTNIRAIERLLAVGEPDRARAFFMAAVDNASSRADFVMLAELASRIKRPDLGIQAVKAAHQKNIMVENGGFPLISMQVPSPPEPALTHALIRQESMFNTEATSKAGARGLMQLMPRTAKDVAKKINIKYDERHLSNPKYNMQLGTTFATQQIARFDGSYVLALAGYNAGSGRVREWMDKFGDPRDPNVDPIDWIELIPINETRNYVQRIMESLQVYRSKLAGGHGQLALVRDLKR